jgi:hypothetical protein
MTDYKQERKAALIEAFHTAVAFLVILIASAIVLGAYILVLGLD